MNSFYSEFIDAAGVQKGDILDVASGLASFRPLFQKWHEEFDANELLDALKRAVGEEGTVMIRTFNWDFCHGVPFHYKTTLSQVGVLGNIALERSDFKRTKHALYSWCVWGKEQDVLTEMDSPDSFGEDSVLAFLENHNASLLRIGNTKVFGLATLHRSEQRANVPWRLMKSFTGQYTGSDNICVEKTYSMFVRNLDYNYQLRYDVIPDNLQKRGAILRHQYQGISIDKVDLKVAGDAVYQDILAGRWGDWIECSKKISP